MTQSLAELVNLGLTEHEAQRIISRKSKADEKNTKAIETAEKRLPKAQAEVDYAASRVKDWQDKAAAAQAKVDRYVGIISGSGESVDDEADSPVEPDENVDDKVEDAPAKKTARTKK